MRLLESTQTQLCGRTSTNDKRCKNGKALLSMAHYEKEDNSASVGHSKDRLNGMVHPSKIYLVQGAFQFVFLRRIEPGTRSSKEAPKSTIQDAFVQPSCIQKSLHQRAFTSLSRTRPCASKKKVRDFRSKIAAKRCASMKKVRDFSEGPQPGAVPL